MKKWFLSSLAALVCSVTLTSGVYALDVDNTPGVNKADTQMMREKINQNLSRGNNNRTMNPATTADQVNRTINNNMDRDRGFEYMNGPNYAPTAVDTNNDDDADYGWLGLLGLVGLLGLRRKKD